MTSQIVYAADVLPMPWATDYVGLLLRYLLYISPVYLGCIYCRPNCWHAMSELGVVNQHIQMCARYFGVVPPCMVGMPCYVISCMIDQSIMQLSNSMYGTRRASPIYLDSSYQFIK
jgi:hypothetical protein